MLKTHLDNANQELANANKTIELQSLTIQQLTDKLAQIELEKSKLSEVF